MSQSFEENLAQVRQWDSFDSSALEEKKRDDVSCQWNAAEKFPPFSEFFRILPEATSMQFSVNTCSNNGKCLSDAREGSAFERASNGQEILKSAEALNWSFNEKRNTCIFDVITIQLTLNGEILVLQASKAIYEIAGACASELFDASKQEPVCTSIRNAKARVFKN